MTVGEIIEAVRFCYDEEALDGANFNNASAQDNTYMDNIIKSKIGDAVRWICLYSPAELLGGTDEPDTEEEQGGQTVTVHHPTGIITDVDSVTPEAITYGSGGFANGGRIPLPGDFIKLVRVRAQDWHRAVKVPFSEDSEEYLHLYDEDGATATMDRPQAALIEGGAMKLEVWPARINNSMITFSYSYVSDVNPEENAFYHTGEDTNPLKKRYPLPPRVKTAFIYYLAFLVLSAYEDSRAPRMLEIAKMNIGKNG